MHHYPTGASYGTHLDRHHDSNARVVSAVIYLNSEWPTDAGGELVIYDATRRPPTHAPAGRRDARAVHESRTRPTRPRRPRANRWSIAGWFHGSRPEEPAHVDRVPLTGGPCVRTFRAGRWGMQQTYKAGRGLGARNPSRRRAKGIRAWPRSSSNPSGGVWDFATPMRAVVSGDIPG